MDQPNVDATASTSKFADLVLVDGDIGKKQIPIQVVDAEGFKSFDSANRAQLLSLLSHNTTTGYATHIHPFHLMVAGSALTSNQVLMPMELAHLRYRKGRTYEDYVGSRGLKRYGKSAWRRHVADVVTTLRDALQADYAVLGGGNAKRLKHLPEHTYLGDNKRAFSGGFRLWKQSWEDECRCP